MNILESRLRVPTDPLTYAKQLRRLMDVHSMSISEIAEKTNQSEEFINEKLSLLK